MEKSAISRDEFSEAIKRRIAQKAMFICSNPQCLRMTGYGTTEGDVRTIAEAAHIAPASKNGPRKGVPTNTKITKSDNNGIWLCSICHKKIDDDPKWYPAKKLHQWKKDHESVIRKIVGKDLETALLDLRNHKNYHDETRELLSFLESKRVLYEGLDHEFPPRVLDSLLIIRERIALTRARVSPDSSVFVALNKIQKAIDDFLRNIGSETDLRVLRCDSRNPLWLKFSNECKSFAVA